MYKSNESFMYTGCASENETEIKNQLWIDDHKYFTANVIYLNTIFNPLNKKSTEKTL